jgi:hypothetical protein
MTFVPHRKHACGPPRPVTERALLVFAEDVTSLATHLWVSTACYGDSFTFSYFNGKQARDSNMALEGEIQNPSIINYKLS